MVPKCPLSAVIKTSSSQLVTEIEQGIRVCVTIFLRLRGRSVMMRSGLSRSMYDWDWETSESPATFL